MENTLFFGIGIILDIIKVTMLNRLFFGIKIKGDEERNKAVIVTFILGIMSMFIFSYYEEARYMIFIYQTCMALMFQVLYEETWIKKQIYSFLSLSIESMLDGTYNVMYSVLGLNEKLTELLAIITTTFTIILGTTFLRKKGVKELKKQKIIWYLGIIAILTADSIILGFLQEILEKESILKYSVPLKIVFLFVGIGMVVEVIAILYLMMSRDVYRERDYYNQAYYATQKEYYESLAMQENEMRKFKHDIKNHFIILWELYQKDIQKGNEYLKTLTGQLEAIPRNIQTGNEIADILVNQYYELMKKDNIKLHVNGRIPEKCLIEHVDICIIFSNILKNSMEAVSFIEKKEVELTLKYDENQIYIQEINEYGTETELKKNEHTWKKDKNSHGFGLENIKRCVNKYDGEMQIVKEKNKFKIMIAIKNMSV